MTDAPTDTNLLLHWDAEEGFDGGYLVGWLPSDPPAGWYDTETGDELASAPTHWTTLPAPCDMETVQS